MKPKRLIGIAIALLLVSLWMFFLLRSQLPDKPDNADALMETLQTELQGLSEMNDFIQNDN